MAGIAIPRVPRLARRMLVAAVLLALAAVVLLAVGPLGWRAGWWHYRVAFGWLMPGAACCAVVAMPVAAAALVLGRRGLGAPRIALAAGAIAVGAGIASVPWHFLRLARSAPPIHDITTDWQNPPQFDAILPLREAAHANSVAYEGTRVSELQRQAYPDIAPAVLNLDHDRAFAHALATAQSLGWDIVASDPEAGRIEASQRSRWFGFTDDVVIRVSPAGSGSRVDIRSVSRVGRSDLGVNAARIRAFLAALRASPQ